MPTATQCEYKTRFGQQQKITQFYTPEMREEKTSVLFFHRRMRRINQGHLYLVNYFMYICVVARRAFYLLRRIHHPIVIDMFSFDVILLHVATFRR